MALSIKNSETERLARQVAKEAGESLTEAIESLSERTVAAAQAAAPRARNDGEARRHSSARG